jgi:uncharacterized protein YjbI with pentapeptide repeats
MADLRDADLYDAHLQAAVLAGAKFGGAALGRAKLHGANLAGADLRDAMGLTPEQLARARCDSTTMLPPRLESDSQGLSTAAQ